MHAPLHRFEINVLLVVVVLFTFIYVGYSFVHGEQTKRKREHIYVTDTYCEGAGWSSHFSW